MAHDVVQGGDRLERLEAAIAALERRLDRLEAATASPVATVVASTDGSVVASTPAIDVPGGFESRLVLPLLGRTFIVFGGAFLLRALTDADRIPRAVGIALGLAYALACIAASERAAARGQRLSAAFHGFAAIAIGLPIIWEAAIRFGLLGPGLAAAVVGLFTGTALLAAWGRRVQSLAGFATVGALLLLPALVIASGGIGPVTFVLILIGFATLWLGYDCDWHWLRWPAALVANIAVLEITTRALRPDGAEPAALVIATQLLLLGGYLALFASRTLVKGRLVIPFEVVQTLCVLAVGLGGAVTVAQRVGTGDVALGVAGATLGVGCYGAAFAFVERRQGLGENFYFYATLALVLTLTGLAVILPRAPLVMVLACLSVAASYLAARTTRVALVLHAAVYAAVAASAAGLVADVATAFIGTPAAGGHAVSGLGWVAVAASGLALLFPAPARPGRTTMLTAGPRSVLALILASGVGGGLVLWAAPAVAGTPPAAATLAMLRTAVLAGAAIVLATATRHERGADLGRLLYPALAFAALKLLFEDFQHAEAGTLFVSLALFGVALVAAPRLVRRRPVVT